MGIAHMKIDISQDKLTNEQLNSLQEMWLLCVRDILNATTLAGCGHPGGSMSSLHFLLLLYGIANITPEKINSPERDRVIISHGHISPGIYSVLSRYGFFDSEEAVINFRKLGSKYAGHIERGVPGIEWNTGNLGQGLSAGVGISLAGKVKDLNYKTIICMGDGEQQKGQISEARRTAVKFKLDNLISIIDYNRYQICGSISDIMPQNIEENYSSDGWNVIHVENGHDFQELFSAFRKVWNKEIIKKDSPTLIMARTTMGNGVSFMSTGFDFHGRACTLQEHKKAFEELGLKNNIDELKEKRNSLPPYSCASTPFVPPKVNIDAGAPIIYNTDVVTDNRSAFGAALADLAKRNNFDPSKNKVVGISCDLESSVKMSSFKKTDPKHFFECGIQEHHAAVMAGSMSKEGFQVFFSTFGIFGVDEVFNQQRLNSFNKTNIKTVCTHLGLSVGEDGPTHQCINYIGLLRNIPNYSIFLPADPNQTDHIIRYIASVYGNFFVGMGRATTPVITNSDGKPFFDSNYKFVPGKADILRTGNDATIIAIGPLVDYAMKTAKKFKNESLNIRVINMASVIPCDKNAIINAAKETKAILTIEDHYVYTGIGSIIDQILIENGISVPVRHLGVTNFALSGTPAELYKDQKMGLDNIEFELKNLIESKNKLN